MKGRKDIGKVRRGKEKKLKIYNSATLPIDRRTDTNTYSDASLLKKMMHSIEKMLV